jgi:hypothetical protein
MSLQPHYKARQAVPLSVCCHDKTLPVVFSLAPFTRTGRFAELPQGLTLAAVAEVMAVPSWFAEYGEIVVADGRLFRANGGRGCAREATGRSWSRLECA